MMMQARPRRGLPLVASAIALLILASCGGPLAPDWVKTQSFLQSLSMELVKEVLVPDYQMPDEGLHPLAKYPAFVPYLDKQGYGVLVLPRDPYYEVSELGAFLLNEEEKRVEVSYLPYNNYEYDLTKGGSPINITYTNRRDYSIQADVSLYGDQGHRVLNLVYQDYSGYLQGASRLIDTFRPLPTNGTWKDNPAPLSLGFQSTEGFIMDHGFLMWRAQGGRNFYGGLYVNGISSPEATYKGITWNSTVITSPSLSIDSAFVTAPSVIFNMDQTLFYAHKNPLGHVLPRWSVGTPTSATITQGLVSFGKDLESMEIARFDLDSGFHDVVATMARYPLHAENGEVVLELGDDGYFLPKKGNRKIAGTNYRYLQSYRKNDGSLWFIFTQSFNSQSPYGTTIRTWAYKY